MARASDLELRLVRDGIELDAAQALRYRVFYEESGAVPSRETLASMRDVDRFDAHADHLVVLDRARSRRRLPHVVGCYRVLRQSVAERHDGFYTAGEFMLDGIRSPLGEMMELGRSCVDIEYRNGAVMQLLWRGVADYIDRYRIGLMLGCASLPGTDQDAAAPVLGWLHRHHLAPPALRPKALPGRCLPCPVSADTVIDEVAVRRALPPLLKAYLRMGGKIGDGAVVDQSLNTIDVCVVLPTAGIQERYQRHCRQHRLPVSVAA